MPTTLYAAKGSTSRKGTTGAAMNGAVLLRITLEYLRDDFPLTIDLEKRKIVMEARAYHIILHVDAHDRSRGRDSQDIETTANVWGGPERIEKAREHRHCRTLKQFLAAIAPHDLVLMESSLDL